MRDHGLRPRARVHHLSARGEDPIRMLTAPIPATAHALKKTGLTLDAIDLVEINEAFAPVVLAWLKETGADPDKVNVNGGAIALGHPLGATGARLMTTLLHELERTGGRYGLQTMCEGRRPGQRDDHRTALTGAGGPEGGDGGEGPGEGGGRADVPLILRL